MHISSVDVIRNEYETDLLVVRSLASDGCAAPPPITIECKFSYLAFTD